MKRDKRLQYGWKIASGMLALMAALLIGLSADSFAITSHAESEGKVTADSAKIRQEPSTSSTSLGSALKDTKVSVKGQTTGADGQIWYQVFVDGNTLGYIRSDLVEITDGSTPETVTPTTTVTPTDGDGATTPPAEGDEPLAAVTAVNPVGGVVKGGQAVRVRQNASTTSRIVTTAQSGMALNVTGTALGSDGKDWYQVSFIAGDAEVNGFIRSEYVEVSGELVPVSPDVPDVTEPADETPEPAAEPQEEVKDWDTYYDGGTWHLVDNIVGSSYDIENIFTIAEDNKKAAEDAISAKRKQMIVIVVLVILLIALAALATYLIFKVRDMADTAYFKEVERETMRRRADRPQEGSRKVMHTVEPDRKSSGQRPAGQRPAGSQGQRPAGSQGQRPAGGQGQRPVSSQGQRPVSGQSQRPAGSQGQRPIGNAERSQRPEGASARQGNVSQEPGWKSKNFMADEDEDFEFRFLNGDGDDDK